MGTMAYVLLGGVGIVAVIAVMVVSLNMTYAEPDMRCVVSVTMEVVDGQIKHYPNGRVLEEQELIDGNCAGFEVNIEDQEVYANTEIRLLDGRIV